MIVPMSRVAGGLLAGALLLGSLGGAPAVAEQAAATADPFEPVNRRIFAFNDALDTWFLRPVAKGYDTITPEPVQRSVGNVFRNLATPGIALNQLLQGKPRAALGDFTRFLVNSTVGIGGLFDPAAANGLPRHEEDFGQTFARWAGGSQGPFLQIPVRGPATTTHALGMVFGVFTNPLMLLSSTQDRVIGSAVDVVDTRAQLLSSERLISGDKYLFLRDAYLQRREFLINDGVVEEDPFLDDF